jgi:hypothetical protein
MGCLARAFGLLILAGWIGGAGWFLVEQKAHGESLVLPLILLGLGILVAAGVVGMTLQRFVPGWSQRSARGPAIVTVALAVVAMAGIYVAVDTGVENRRPGRELTAALAPACRGVAVPAASAISTDGTPNHLVVLDAAGNEVDWTGHPATELRPPNLADAELVVCVEAEAQRTQIEVCTYTNGPPITRYAVSRDVEVHAARTGAAVMAFTETAQPRACRQTESKELTELVGMLDWAQVEKSLAYLVAWGVDPVTVLELGSPIVLTSPDTDGLTAIGLTVRNAGRAPLSFEIFITDAAKSGTGGETIDVADLAPGERRVVTATVPDLDATSSVAPAAKVGSIVTGDANPDALRLARAVSITPPKVPIEPGTLAVEAGIRNGSSARLDASVVLGFLRDGQLVGVAQGSVRGLTAGGSATATLDIAGSATEADEVLAQVDSAVAVE